VELKQIKELMAAMGRTGTKRFALKRENYELVIEREEHTSFRYLDPQTDFPDDAFRQSVARNRTDQALSRGSEMPAGPASSPIPKEEVKEAVSSTFVTSPMVGTYYSAPSPEDPPFIKVGDRVEKNSIVCIIEAMKVMNEIKANAAGVIAEILVETGQPVEYGTKLFRIIE